MLEQFKIMLGKEVEDRIANVYINRATSTVLKLTKRGIEEIELLQDVIVDLAIYRYNMQGVEHLKTEKYSVNASFEYLNDIPAYIMKEIKELKVRKLRVL